MVQKMSGPEPVIILTRPAAQSARFAEELRADGITAPIVVSPVTKISAVSCDEALPEFDGAIFTSRNGVAYGPDGKGQAWCVGDKTADDASAKGWNAISASGDVENLLQRICADLKGAPEVRTLIHFCGAEARGDLAERLTDVGISTSRHTVYRQDKLALNGDAIAALSDPISPVFPIFSPNSAKRLASQIPAGVQAHFVAISQATANALPAGVIKSLRVASFPTAQSLIIALRHAIYGEKGS